MNRVGAIKAIKAGRQVEVGLKGGNCLQYHQVFIDQEGDLRVCLPHQLNPVPAPPSRKYFVKLTPEEQEAERLDMEAALGYR